jgi:hypothetical protein
MYIFFIFFSYSEMVAAGVITTEQDLIASLLSESLAELSAALSPEKVTSSFLCNISDLKLCKTSPVTLPSEYLAELSAALSPFALSPFATSLTSSFVRYQCHVAIRIYLAGKGNLTPHLPHL